MDERRTRAWLVVAALWPVALLNYLDRLMLTTMREPIVAEIPMTDAQFGLLTSIFLWVYGVLSPFGGYLADRYGRRAVILGSLAAWSGITWATGRMEGLGGLLAARGLMGISEACYLPAALALIADHHPGRTRSLATGLHFSGIYAGAALGGVGGVISERFGWRPAFTLFGVAGLVYAPVLLLALRDRPPADPEAGDAGSSPEPGAPADRPSPGEALRALASEPGFWLLAALNALVGVSNWVVYAWLPTYLRDRFALGLGAAGLSATAYLQVASFFGGLAGGAWADAWSRTRPRARAIVPALGYLAAAPCLFLTASTGALPAAVAGLIAFGVGRGIYDANLMPMLRQVVPPRFSATGYGLLNLVGSVAGGLMIYAGGALRDAHFDLARIFQAAALGLAVAAVLLLAMPKRPARAATALAPASGGRAAPPEAIP
jgi:MFS transporter, Spinster family, sphingosine-1-phosphate transporter